jgi:hypothetical protein
MTNDATTSIAPRRSDWNLGDLTIAFDRALELGGEDVIIEHLDSSIN